MARKFGKARASPGAGLRVVTVVKTKPAKAPKRLTNAPPATLNERFTQLAAKTGKGQRRDARAQRGTAEGFVATTSKRTGMSVTQFMAAKPAPVAGKGKNKGTVTQTSPQGRLTPKPKKNKAVGRHGGTAATGGTVGLDFVADGTKKNANKAQTKKAKQTALSLKPVSAGIAKKPTNKKKEAVGEKIKKGLPRTTKKETQGTTPPKKDQTPQLPKPKRKKVKKVKRVRPDPPKPEDLDKDLDVYMAAAPETVPSL